MATNLLDTIRQNRGAAAAQQAPLTDETQRVQQLLRAKSGKAVAPGTGGEAAISNLGEQSQVQDTQSRLNQLGQQAQIQSQGEQLQAAGQQQAERLQRQDIDQSRKFDSVQNRIQTQSLLNDLSRDRGNLDLQKDQARLEKASFLLSMQDRQYTDKLQDIGKRRRLDNEAAFRNEMAEVAFGDNLDLLRQKLGGADVLSANDRDFRRAMSDLSIDDAVQIASIESKALAESNANERNAAIANSKNAIKQANEKAKWEALSQAASGGLSAYNTYQNQPTTPTPGRSPVSNTSDYSTYSSASETA